MKHFYLLLFVFSFVQGEPFDPTALLLTWEDSPATSQLILWMSESKEQGNSLEYSPRSPKEWKKETPVSSSLQLEQEYTLYKANLQQLSPDTDYLFRFEEGGKEYLFHTPPTSLTNSSLSFIVGGDCFQGKDPSLFKETNRKAASLDPAFILIGGDIAYTARKRAHLPEKGERWVTWLKVWKETMISPEGRLIPLVAAIGNHDVKGGYGQTPSEASTFYSLFIHGKHKSYSTFDFGTYLSILRLDSGHTELVPGAQTDWLKTTLSSRKEVPHLFAFYHVPAYPSHRKFSHPDHKEIRDHWVPLFEEFHLSCAFEHHEHAYKRTHPLLNGKIDPKGILYLGDGAWSVKKTRSSNKEWYLAKTAALRHFIHVSLSKDKRHYTAITPEGTTFDQYSQPTATSTSS